MLFTQWQNKHLEMASSKLIRVYICLSLAVVLLHPAWCLGDCGMSSGPPPQEGRSNVEPGAWPWMVAIVKLNRAGEETYICSGFLIDRIHVVTSAHCFEANHTNLYSTRIGDVDMTRGDEFSISRISIHEGYKRREFYDDIALLTLSEEVDAPDFNPVCLPLPSALGNLTGKATTVVSWGATKMVGPLSKTLMQFSGLTVWSNEMCNLAYKLFKPSRVPQGITSGMICAGYLNGTTEGICYGSAGSPLMIQDQGKWYAIGVTSFGYQCGNPDYPDVYTNVSEYLAWIDENKY